MRCSLAVIAGAAASLGVVSSSQAGTGQQDPPLPNLGRTVSLVIVPSTMEASPGDFVQFFVSAVDTMAGSHIANAQFTLSPQNLIVGSATFAGEPNMFQHSSTTRAVVNPLANRDGIGGVDSRDVLRYVNAYSTLNISADIDLNPGVTIADLNLFRAAYDQNPPISGAPGMPFAGLIDALQTPIWGDTVLMSGSRMLGTVSVQIDPLAPIGSIARLDGTMLAAAVYDDSTGLFARSAMVENGLGSIQIVPAPGVSVGGLVAMGVLATLRRRR